MNWQTLLQAQKVKQHKTSRQEIDDLRDVVDRDFADSSKNGYVSTTVRTHSDGSSHLLHNGQCLRRRFADCKAGQGTVGEAGQARSTVEQMIADVSRSKQVLRVLLHNYFTAVRRIGETVQGCQSGQMDLTVNQAGFAIRRFESYPLHCFR